MALSLVKLHKQPKGLGERPVLGRCFLAALVPLPARVERERVIYMLHKSMINRKRSGISLSKIRPEKARWGREISSQPAGRTSL